VTKKRNPPIPLPDRLLAHLRRWEADGARYLVEYAGKSVARVDKVLGDAAREAGLGKVAPHCLRHTAASWQVQSGTDLYEAGAYLGMSVATLTSVYAHHHPQHLTRAKEAYTRHRQRIANETSEKV
jgi:integrase